MKLKNILIVVKDIEKSRKYYHNLYISLLQTHLHGILDPCSRALRPMVSECSF